MSRDEYTEALPHEKTGDDIAPPAPAERHEQIEMRMDLDLEQPVAQTPAPEAKATDGEAVGQLMLSFDEQTLPSPASDTDDDANAPDAQHSEADEEACVTVDAIADEDVPTADEEAAVPAEEQVQDSDEGAPTEEAPEASETREPKERTVHTVFDLVELITLTLVAVLLVTIFFFRHSIVDGASMESTLYDGDHLIISSAFYTPAVGDVIVFEDYSTGHKRPLVKRIIATEGQTVTVLSDTEVLVDGVRITGGFVDGVSYDYTYPMEPVTVSEGCVFVMGDHRNNSTDSRRFGEISVESILGKVLLRVYPFDAFGAPAPLPMVEEER